MIDAFFLFLIIAIWVCICAVKCAQNREDESGAHGELPAFRETMSQRRSRIRRGETPSAPSQDPEEQRKSQVKSVLFSRKLEVNESVGSLQSVLSATKEKFNDSGSIRSDGGGSKRGGSFVSRSWRAASHSVRALSREDCSICLDKYEKGDTVCWSKKDECDHIFHQDCISQWLHEHDECPLCRTNLFEGVDVEKDEEESEGNTTEERNANEG